ncbi:hypothetical protein [Parathalassolituus penaei]|uniref:Uncharacterized protein n=1 Tax=Parathalassolituus penaei TaxID=2997323 RepID=A0A9X3ELC6_9GAMM|nr:hypothetical protein [Parathalassolituus penaei]MCY0966481.1 hypothetical protein [Parathalassolituus penaei]
MKRQCQECGNQSVKLDLIGFRNRLLCESCSAQYEMTSGQKWLVSFGGAFLMSAAIYAGILAQSWLVFFFTGFGLPLALDIFVRKYAKLKLGALKVCCVPKACN